MWSLKKKVLIQENSSSKRIAWIDFAKGILILLVIIGHSTGIAVVRGTIYSFHMPAFFILSGMTMKWYKKRTDITKNINKLLKSLIQPAILLLVISLGESLLVNIHRQSFSPRNFFITMLCETLWPGGTHFKLGKYHVSAEGGMYWFLIVLFDDKVILEFANFFATQLLFSKLSDREKELVNIFTTIIAACIGVWLGIHNFWLPFSFDLILSTTCFLSVGHFIKHSIQNRNFRAGFSGELFLWAISFCIIGVCRDAYLDIKIRRYPLFPLCYICAMNGTLALCYFSQMIKPSLYVYRVLQYIGRHSLVLFCIHTCDHWYCDWFANICSNIFLQVVFRILADVAVMFAYLSIKNAIQNKKLPLRHH